ncbi:MAG: hypothetical protein JSV91_05045, partial [Phycisphaerales bacterium]
MTDEPDRPEESGEEREGFPIPPVDEPDKGVEKKPAAPRKAGADEEAESKMLSDEEEALRRSQVASLLGRAESERTGETPATLPEQPPPPPAEPPEVEPPPPAEVVLL